MASGSNFPSVTFRTDSTSHPVQIFSAINAAVICFFLWSFYPFRRRDGQVAALLLTIYPATRFLLEMVRIDEESVLKLGFRLTISQTISLVLLAGAIAFWTFLMTRPRGSALPLVGDGKSGRLRAEG